MLTSPGHLVRNTRRQNRFIIHYYALILNARGKHSQNIAYIHKYKKRSLSVSMAQSTKTQITFHDDRDASYRRHAHHKYFSSCETLIDHCVDRIDWSVQSRASPDRSQATCVHLSLILKNRAHTQDTATQSRQRRNDDDENWRKFTSRQHSVQYTQHKT